MGAGKYADGYCDGPAFHPGRVAILLVALCRGNRELILRAKISNREQPIRDATWISVELPYVISMEFFSRMSDVSLATEETSAR